MKYLSHLTLVSLLAIILTLSLLLTACSSEPVVSTSSPTLEKITSPIETPIAAFESPVQPTPVRGPDFIIDERVKAGDTVVHGTGPRGVAIRIVDVSRVGKFKGTGVINEDGTFAIEVTPVEAGNVLGIMLENLEGTDYTLEDFRNNENYQDMPMVGLLFDMYQVPMN